MDALLPELPVGYTAVAHGSIILVIRDRDESVVTVMTREQDLATQVAEDTCKRHKQFCCFACFDGISP